MDRRGINGARHERGLTLLELLVVMAILALLVTVAVFNAPPPRSSARAEAERFAARLVAASEQAVLQGAVMSIEMTPAGYRVLRYAGGKWTAGGDTGGFTERRFGRGVSVTLIIEDAALANRSTADGAGAKERAQRIVLDPVGVAPAFEAAFADSRGRWLVRGGENQTVEVVDDGPR